MSKIRIIIFKNLFKISSICLLKIKMTSVTPPNKKTMAIIIPTRERSHKIKKLHEQWFSVTDPSIHTDCHIVLDNDNESTYERLPGFIYHIVDTGGKKGVVIPLNKIAIEIANDYEYLGFIGDDHFPRTKNWNTLMYNILIKNGKFSMVYGNDLLQKENLCTHIVMDSQYIIQLGYFAHPSFSHLHCDVIWMYMGERKNNIHYLPDVIIEHLHYIAQKSPNDNMYTINNSEELWHSSQKIYNNLINSDEFNSTIDKLN
jgi:hypothetical protein